MRVTHGKGFVIDARLLLNRISPGRQEEELQQPGNIAMAVAMVSNKWCSNWWDMYLDISYSNMYIYIYIWIGSGIVQNPFAPMS